MPVMKILGGSTVEEPLKYAMNRIPLTVTSDQDASISKNRVQDSPPIALDSLPISETVRNTTAVHGSQSLENESVWTSSTEDPSSSSEYEDLDTGATSLPSSVQEKETNSILTVISYRSGDHGRIRTRDGALVYGGQIAGDTQIKLYGVRIELRDIESTVVASGKSHLADAIVPLRCQTQHLVAHAVLNSGIIHFPRHKKTCSRAITQPSQSPVLHEALSYACLGSRITQCLGKVDRHAISEIALPDIVLQEESTSQESITHCIIPRVALAVDHSETQFQAQD